jgi:hypothetical protein
MGTLRRPLAGRHHRQVYQPRRGGLPCRGGRRREACPRRPRRGHRGLLLPRRPHRPAAGARPGRDRLARAPHRRVAAAAPRSHQRQGTHRAENMPIKAIACLHGGCAGQLERRADGGVAERGPSLAKAARTVFLETPSARVSEEITAQAGSAGLQGSRRAGTSSPTASTSAAPDGAWTAPKPSSPSARSSPRRLRRVLALPPRTRAPAPLPRR